MKKTTKILLVVMMLFIFLVSTTIVLAKHNEFGKDSKKENFKEDIKIKKDGKLKEVKAVGVKNKDSIITFYPENILCKYIPFFDRVFCPDYYVEINNKKEECFDPEDLYITLQSGMNEREYFYPKTYTHNITEYEQECEIITKEMFQGENYT